MNTVVTVVAAVAGAVSLALAGMELYQYRKFRQAYVNAGILPGTKKKAEG